MHMDVFNWVIIKIKLDSTGDQLKLLDAQKVSKGMFANHRSFEYWDKPGRYLASGRGETSGEYCQDAKS